MKKLFKQVFIMIYVAIAYVVLTFIGLFVWLLRGNYNAVLFINCAIKEVNEDIYKFEKL